MIGKVPGLGDLLIRDGLITPDQLKEALAEQTRTHERLGEILHRLGYITESDLLDVLARQLNHRRYDPARDAVETSVLDMVPLEFARRHNLLPLRRNGKSLIVAMNDPLDVEAIDHLRRIARRFEMDNLEILLAGSEALESARESNYERVRGSRHVVELIDKVVDDMSAIGMAEEELDQDEAQRRAEEAGIVNLVDQFIAQALQERATDIHVEMHDTGLVIRYRVDGLLYDAHKPPRAVYTGVISRIKIMSNMDIAERRAAQDGRFSYRKEGNEVDVRVSSIPTIHGEKIVMRLLDKTNFNFSLHDLGLSEEDYQVFTRAIRQPYGMVLLSGPTGSGKSTTLYSSLLELRDETVNITTVEDPVEYQIAGINQVQVNARKNVTFVNALRYFLRQDPDIIMVGEIRDQETAEIAVRAALTGHLVFSTIHANDAPSTATRLLSMGVESFMTASSLNLVAAQRLVRRNCKLCREEYQPSEESMLAFGSALPALMGSEKPRFFKGAGCEACRGRGFSGRVAIIERMVMTPGLRQLIAENRPAAEIRKLAVSEGMKTLRESGLAKALKGQTTLEEVLRVCLSDD